MKYVLVMLLSLRPYHIEFSTYDACAEAREAIVKALAGGQFVDHSDSFRRKMLCVRTGK